MNETATPVNTSSLGFGEPSTVAKVTRPRPNPRKPVKVAAKADPDKKPAKPAPGKDELAAREKEIRKTYKAVISGSIRRETNGHHVNKLTVNIECCERGCKNVRRVATSDLFQVSRCEGCAEEHRKALRRKTPSKNGKK